MTLYLVSNLTVTVFFYTRGRFEYVSQIFSVLRNILIFQ